MEHTKNKISFFKNIVSLATIGIAASSLLCGVGCGSSDTPAAEPGAQQEPEADGGVGPGAVTGAGGGVTGTGGGANTGGGPAVTPPLDGGADSAIAKTEDDMFNALGVDTTPTPRTYVDRKGTSHTLDDSYNPLGRGTKSLRPISEIYLAGRSLPGSASNQLLIDDLKNGPAKTPLTVNDSADTWTANRYAKAIAADLDGDGVDEIVNAYWIEADQTLHANVVRCTTAGGCKGNGGEFTNVKDTRLAVQDSTKKPLNRHWFAHGFVAADIDGDGKQELVVANFGGIDVCKVDANFVFTCNPQSANASQKMSLARGHLDDNPEKANDDVVAAWSDGSLAYVSIYDGTPNAFGDNAFTSATHDPTPMSIKFVDQTTVTSYAEAYVATGDVDLDGRDEIVLSAGVAGTYPMRHDLVLMDDAQVSYRFFRAFRLPLGPDGGKPWILQNGILMVPNPENFLYRPALTVFTKRSEPALEKAIYAGAFIIDGLENLLPSDTTTLPQDTDITNNVGRTKMAYFETGGGGWNHAPSEVVAGDIDGSGQDTIVALWDQTNEDAGNQGYFTPPWIATVTFDSGTGKWPRWTNSIETTGGLAPATGGAEGDYDGEYGTGLALPNVDHDSPIVEYQGQHELLFGTPRVLAMLAAAPFFAGENETYSQTSISFGSGTGTDGESTIGVRASASIGYEAPNLFGTSKFETKLTVGWGMDWISSSGVRLEETQTWTAGNEDAVVFQVIPFDVYYYKVLSSPDPADLDKPLTINVPRSLSTYKVPVDLYNRSIVGGPSIDPGLLTHTVGDPASYPKTNPCVGASSGGTFGTTSFVLDANKWCYASSQASHVGVGTGSVGFEIARTATTSKGMSTDIGVDFSVEAGAGGVVVGASTGFHFGYEYTVDTTESYSFAGQVGDLPDTTHGYDFGLAVHRGQLGGLATNYPVFLVDYWVENVQ